MRSCLLMLLLAAPLHAQGIQILSPVDGERIGSQTLVCSGTVTGAFNYPVYLEISYKPAEIGNRWIYAGSTDVFWWDYNVEHWHTLDVSFYAPRDVKALRITVWDAWGLYDDVKILASY